MAFNGSGIFNRIHNWIVDRDAGIKIRADRMDAEMDGFATGLSNCLTKDGQNASTADQAMGGFKITGLGEPVSGSDAVTKTYVDASGGGMDTSTYDPNSREADVFEMDNMVESATAKIMTDVERTAIATNSAKISYTDAAAVAANTAKISYTDAAAVAANTAKVSYTDASQVAANTSKLSGIADNANVGALPQEVRHKGNISESGSIDLINGGTFDLPAGFTVRGLRCVAPGVPVTSQILHLRGTRTEVV